MNTQSSDHDDQPARALEVRYRHVTDEPLLVRVHIISQTVEATGDHVERSEAALICANEEMTVQDVQARVQAEEQARDVERVV